MNAINIKGFTKKYGDLTAVKCLDLSVSAGEIVGFVGKNGAGKSTTLRSMIDMLHVTEGSISILGLDSERDAKQIKSRVSYVPSESIFYENVTCEKLLRFAASFTDTPLEEISKLSEYFELDLTKKVMELSLGNRKKVSLIQGFLKNAELIVLDEPTSGLDPLMQNKFFELILQEKKKGKTIFLSSHNLSEIEKYCDKVAIIKGGELVDYFEMDEVKTRHKQVVTYTTVDGITESFEIEENIKRRGSKARKS